MPEKVGRNSFHVETKICPGLVYILFRKGVAIPSTVSTVLIIYLMEDFSNIFSMLLLNNLSQNWVAQFPHTRRSQSWHLRGQLIFYSPFVIMKETCLVHVIRESLRLLSFYDKWS